MEFYLRVMVTTFCLFGGGSMLSADSTEQNEQIEENNTIWIGPGWYGGVWFDNEEDFNRWHGEGNYHGDYHHDGDYHRDDDEGGHGGRGEGGGGHGGGGHGGR